MWLPLALIAASLIFAQCQTIVEVDVTESRAFRNSLTDTVIKSCFVTLPSGDSYELLPNETVISSIDERFAVSSIDKTTECGLSIDSTTYSDSGVYSISITDEDGVAHVKSYRLRIQARAPIWPSSTVNLIASETVFIFLQSPGGSVQKCYVTPPNSQEIEVKNGGAASTGITQWSPSSESWCGVQISNVNSTGYWKLTAAVNSTHYYYNRTLLKPDDFLTLDKTLTTVTPVVGQSLTDYIGHENASYCQLTNPQGEIDQMVAGRCSFNISLVTSQHDGNWTVHTGLKGSPTEITETVQLSVQKIPYIYAISSANKVIDGAIDLYCRVDGAKSEVCRFVSPSGTGVSMVLGVGNDKYAPYYDSEGLYTCGLTIIELSSEDYGTWTCYTGNTTDVRIGYISVPSPESRANDLTRSTSTTDSITVSESYTAFSVYNESLTLVCSAMTSIEYCWFGHPNGSYYTASPEDTDNELWVYSGSGLSLGSCSITFARSTYDDAGSWTCNMGISGQETDVGVDITVKITSSSLTARSVEQSGATATVECAVLDNTRALSYCRFIRPDGVGINALYSDSDSRYSTSGDLAQGSCTLTINSVESVDIGTWVCAAKLQSLGLELSDTFRFNSAPKLELSLLLVGYSVVKAFIG